MSKIFLEILDHNRQEILKDLSTFRNEGYLAGGTALALQIGHRSSYDFDIFMDQRVTRELKNKIRRKFGKVTYSWDSPEQITFNILKRNVSLTFVLADFKPFFPLVPTPYIDLASVQDIAADKAYTIGRRATWRDYVDIFVILNKGFVNLSDIINFARKKCEGEFSEMQFLEQLAYFKDIKETPIEFIRDSYTYGQITSGLKKEVSRHTELFLK